MKMRSLLILIMIGTLALPAALAMAVENDPAQEQLTFRDQEQVYGRQLMTEQERNIYRERMLAAQTAEERERIRQEHHEQMQERARAQGLSLPDTPPSRGGGMGPGGGKGMGGGWMGGGTGGNR